MLQFRRIFDRKEVAHKLCLVVLILVVLWSIAFAFISLFPCFPIQKAMDPLLEGHCYGLGVVFNDPATYMKTLIAQAATNMTLDLMILGIAGYLIKIGSIQVGFRLRLAVLVIIGLLYAHFLLLYLSFESAYRDILH